MIYLKDIHKCDDQFMADKDYMETAEFIESCRTDINMARAHAQALDEFGLFTEAAEVSVNKGVSGMIKRLGNKILEIIEKIKTTISNAMKDFKAKIWESKSKEQQIREVTRKFPKQADQIRAAVNREDLSFATYKDLEDFYKSSDEILAAIEKRQVNPKSLRGKWEKAKQKIHDNEKLIATTATVLGIAISAGTLYITYTKSRPEKLKNDNDAMCKTMEANTEKYRAAMLAIRNVNEHEIASGHSENAVDDAERLSLIAEILNEMQSITGDSSRKAQKLYAKIIDQCFEAAKNHGHTKGAATIGETLAAFSRGAEDKIAQTQIVRDYGN
jgi:hypothetical protein